MRKIIFLAILTVLALIISLFESIIPLPILVPGMKLGLSNIVILVTLVCFGFKETIVVAVFKSVLQVLATGIVSSFFYSFIGIVFSVISMGIALKLNKNHFLSLIGISEIGALMFNIGQILVASVILNNFKIFSLLPFLTFTGIFTGYFVGISSIFISDKLKKVLNFNEGKKGML